MSKTEKYAILTLNDEAIYNGRIYEFMDLNFDLSSLAIFSENKNDLDRGFKVLSEGYKRLMKDIVLSDVNFVFNKYTRVLYDGCQSAFPGSVISNNRITLLGNEEDSKKYEMEMYDRGAYAMWVNLFDVDKIFQIWRPLKSPKGIKYNVREKTNPNDQHRIHIQGTTAFYKGGDYLFRYLGNEVARLYSEDSDSLEIGFALSKDFEILTYTKDIDVLDIDLHFVFNKTTKVQYKDDEFIGSIIVGKQIEIITYDDSLSKKYDCRNLKITSIICM